MSEQIRKESAGERDRLCCFGDGSCNLPQTNQSFYCENHEPKSITPVAGELLGTRADFPNTPHPEGTCWNCDKWKPILTPIAGAGEGGSIVDNPGCAFSVWYFTRHFLGQDITLGQASKSLHTESLAEEYGKFLKTGKLLPPAFVASSPVEGGPEQPTLSFLVKRAAIMPDSSIGCVLIGEFAGDRSKDLELTLAQARTLAKQITQAIGA